MQDFLLLVLLLVIYLFGWFLMKKVDAFLDENRKVHDIMKRKD